jgi:CheY-like chemotaxis protein
MPRILVIDDDVLVRETIGTMLRLEGHEAALAPRGEEGLRRCREQAFDLVICDMPETGGMETVTAIRRLSTEIPIITLTDPEDAMGEGDPDDAFSLHMTHLAGATATIAKPFKPRALFALIGQCLGGKAPHTSQ